MLLSERADIYRLLNNPSKPGQKLMKAWRKGVLCHLEPVSSIDHTVQFALESTHCVYLPLWLQGVRKEDEIRIGGRITPDNTRVPKRYIVKGVRRFPAFGLRHQMAYVEERE